MQSKKGTIKTLLLLASIMLFSGSLYAEIYKWTDSNGQVVYGGIKPVKTPSEQLNLKDNTYSAPDFTPADSETVFMYATSWCGYCKKARAYFNDNKIPFTEYDIEKDEEAHKRYAKLGGAAVPLILYGEERMTGFSEEHFLRMYAPKK